MKSIARHWKLIGLAALAAILIVPLVIALQGTSQTAAPISQLQASQLPNSLDSNSQKDESNQPSVANENEDEKDMNAANGIDLADTKNEDTQMPEAGEFALLQDQQSMPPMMEQTTSEQIKLAQQNQLLLLIDRLGLSKDQLTQLKNITADLIKARDEHRAAIAKQQKDVNDFLLKFQGSEEDLKKGLAPLQKAAQDLNKAFLDKIAAAEKTLKQSLNFEQGEKLAKAAARGPKVMIFQHRMMMKQGQRFQGQPPMMRQPMMGQKQERSEKGPQVGPLGRFLLRHLDALDAALAAKLAALGS